MRQLLTSRRTGEGLEKDGTSISQIPTYVTGVPNGTEKVSKYLQQCTKIPADSIAST